MNVNQIYIISGNHVHIEARSNTRDGHVVRLLQFISLIMHDHKIKLEK
jgi:hypothetical protein